MAHIIRRRRTLKQRIDARPEQCPECRSERVRLRYYGFPDFRDLEQFPTQLSEQGCLVSADDREWDCADCGHEWGESGESAFELRVWPTRKSDRRR